MFFRENPFYLLGVHSRDTAETIRTASLEKQGAAKSGEEKHMYQLAEERLLHDAYDFGRNYPGFAVWAKNVLTH